MVFVGVRVVPAISGEIDLGQADKKPQQITSLPALSYKKAKRLRKVGELRDRGTERPDGSQAP